MNPLAELKMYFQAGGRCTGRTYAMMRGAESQPGCIVIVHSHNYAMQLKEMFPTVDVRGPQSPDSLAGVHRPVLVDHFYQEVLVEQGQIYLRRRIEELEKRDENKKTKPE